MKREVEVVVVERFKTDMRMYVHVECDENEPQDIAGSATRLHNDLLCCIRPICVTISFTCP